MPNPESQNSIFSLSSILSLSSFASISNSDKSKSPNTNPSPSRQSPFRFLNSYSDSESSTISLSSSNSNLDRISQLTKISQRKKNIISTISLNGSRKAASSSATICPPLASMKELIILSDEDMESDLDKSTDKYERKSIAEFILDKKDIKPIERTFGSTRETFL